MHVRQLLIISSLILAGNVAFGADLDPDDVPSGCHSACDPLVSISQRCDRQTDNDAAEARYQTIHPITITVMMTIPMTVVLMTMTHMIYSLPATFPPRLIPLPLLAVASGSGDNTAHRARITLRLPVTRLPLVAILEDSTARRARTTLRPPVTRLPLVAILEDSTAHRVCTIPRPLATRLHLLAIGLKDKAVRQARITLRPPVTRRPLVVVLEDRAVRQARITLRPPVTRRPLVAILEDSTAHRVCTILRPVIARLPQRIPLPMPLGTNNENSIDVPDTTDIQGVRKPV
ncbi:hypothetical protein BDV09DRAFT_194902 [Aspergillus tetrazonus]